MLLVEQNDLTELEKKLDNNDLFDASNPTMKFRLQGHERYYGWDDEQRKIVAEARSKYMEYSRKTLAP